MSETVEPITINLADKSGLDPETASVWVSGFINNGEHNLGVLNDRGTFVQSIKTATVTIDSTKPWQKTGLVSPAGSESFSVAKISVTSIKGSWTADPSTNHHKKYGADGCPGREITNTYQSYPLAGVNQGALVGRIGPTGGPFLVDGSHHADTEVDTGGELELCINDDLKQVTGPGLDDNQGSLTITLSIIISMPFFKVSSVPSITLAEQTSGGNRLYFMVSKNRPESFPITDKSVVPPYTTMPYFSSDNNMAPGPYDIVEFGYDAAFDVSAVNGFRINLSLAYGNENYGPAPSVSRQDIGAAVGKFINNQKAVYPNAAAFADLLYDGPIATGAPAPTLIDKQFIEIADPYDMYNSLDQMTTPEAKAKAELFVKLCDDMLSELFVEGNHISISLGGDGIYSGKCSPDSSGVLQFSLYKPGETEPLDFKKP